MIMVDEHLFKRYHHRRKLCTRTDQLLEKYKEKKDSYNVCIKEDIPIYGIYKKKDKFNNDMKASEKKEEYYGNPLNISGCHKLSKKKKCCVFETQKCSPLEKKIFKELDYMDFLKNNRTISDKVYRKIICKKLALRISLPLLLFLFLSISLILDLCGSFGFIEGLYKVLDFVYVERNKWADPFSKTLSVEPFKSFCEFTKELQLFYGLLTIIRKSKNMKNLNSGVDTNKSR
ncbi:Plasmodium exported protein (Pm-fam-a like), unknown function [Plasmodium malariae]|uniref:Fam-l protein n=1 Tax=Plasmodium malariae TaxID=5858 RepID=A0A1A8X6N8_PLAMA|nr:Plasmodium exported protein (Pm-fam-a like), unknown function [Plasmodium malariae]